MNSNAYAPPKAAVADIDPAAGLVLAGRGMRLLGFIIDTIVTCLFVYLPLVVTGNLQRAAAEMLSDPDNPFIFYSVAFAGMGGALSLVGFIVWCVITYILVRRNGQTIAKKLLGIKVVRSDGSKASVGRIFWVRNFIPAVLSVLLVYIFWLVDHLFIFGERRQCLHDKMADTIVVNA